MNGEELTEYWQKCAWEFGASARANDLSPYPTKDDRFDMADKAGYEDWSEVPTEQQQEMKKIFAAGWKAEDEHHRW